MSYILYNMTIDGIYDPLVFQKFEERYRTVPSKAMSGRIAFGGLWAYFKSNQGTMYGVDFWTSKLEDYLDDIRAHEIVGLLEAFRDNR